MTSELSQKVKDFLQERHFAVLATINQDGTPQLTTMWYLFENDMIVMNTKAGRVKERNLRRDPRISVCFENGYSYLTISGKAELIDDPETAQHDIHRLAVRYNGEEAAKRQVEQTFSKEKRVTIHLRCEQVIDGL